MSKKRGAFLPAAVLLLAATAVVPLQAQSTLFYLEAQGVGGYSSAAGKFVYYSQEQMEAMQKPGLGFDFVQRFSGASGDFAILAVQARLAWNGEGDKALEPQIFNAYLKFKLKPFDLWIGHERPSFGLSAVLDSHGLLLQPLAMRGYGFDRDWGIGLSRQTETGDLGLSLTTGSGMDLRFRGNYFLAARIGRGDSTQGNVAAGLSFGYGRLLDVVGTNVLSGTLKPIFMAALDLTWIGETVEHRFEMAGGDRDGFGSYAILYRFGLGLLEQNRLRLEVQPSAILDSGHSRYELALGAAYLLHPDWTLRTMAVYDSFLRDFRLVFQVYFFKGLLF